MLLKLALVIAVALAITVPFLGQEFSLDGPLMLDYAQMQVDHPFNQHLDDFTYFGIHYDQFTNTHPRLLSFYLSLIIRLTGGVYEVPIHAALAIFPVIGGVGMFFLGRRFGVSGVAAALLFLASPALMVNAHLEMVDVPGTSLWVAFLAVFIYGVDRRSAKLLALSSLLLILSIFTFFQGLVAMVLAFVYLFIHKRFDGKTIATLLIPALLFLGYLYYFFKIYGAMPRFTYRRELPDYDKNPAGQLRGVATVIGGTVVFPLVVVVGYCRQWRAILFFLTAGAATWAWSGVKYAMGEYSLIDAVVLSVLLPAGLTVIYVNLEAGIVSLLGKLRKKETSKDIRFLTLWFFLVLFYCVIILPFPSPRYFLPAAPAVILLMFVLWRNAFQGHKAVRMLIASIAIGLTLSFSITLSLAYMETTRIAGSEAADVGAEFRSVKGRTWYNGELSFNYYMRKYGYRMLPNVQNETYGTGRDKEPENPLPGDTIISSGQYGNWLPYREVIMRTRQSQIYMTYTSGPVSLARLDNTARWGASTFLPYSFTSQPEKFDEITIWNVVEEPLPLPDELRVEMEKWEK